jgi:tetratricopeptide (TPR) repeat protein
MKNKFRVKLKNGRIVGPFDASQVGELYSKGHIDGSEKCQSYPVGDWEPFKNFDKLKSTILNIINEDKNTDVIDHSTKIDTMARLGIVNKVRSGETEKNNTQSGAHFNEFKFEIKQKKSNINYEELERKHNEKLEDDPDEEDEEAKEDATGFDFSGLAVSNSYDDTNSDAKSDSEESNVDKTRIVRVPVNEKTIEKTVVLQKNILEKLQTEQEKSKTRELEKEKIEQEDKSEDEAEISTNDATQFININELLPAVKQDVEMVEREIENKIAFKEKVKEKEIVQAKQRREERRNRREVITKKGMKPVVAITFFVLIWYLIYDDDGKKGPPLPQHIKISFPVAQAYEDNNRAKEFLADGKESYSKETFVSKAIAAKYFRTSLTHKFKNNLSLGWLIRTYSEIYDNAKDKAKAAIKIHKLLKIGDSKLLQDVNIAIGSATFYSSYGKYKTAVNVIENFLRVGKPNLKILSVYLNVLIKEGELTKARKVFDKLNKIPKKSLSIVMALTNFLEQDEKITEADAIVTEALKKKQKSIPLLLKSSKYKFALGEYKKMSKRLNIVKEMNYGGSLMDYARYLENMGMLSAANQKLSKAASYFNKALKINESDELRSKLATLSLGGTESVEALILQSKVINKIKYAKLAVREKNWEKAFKFSIGAADLLPSYIPAQLLLADIQTKRGFFESAIKTLIKLKKENPVNPNVNFRLIMSYVLALKLEDAHNLIQMISQTKLRDSAGYASTLGKYYLKKKNDVLAVKWLKESIKRFPLNDEDYYLLARIYLRNRKYDNSLQMLGEAIALDPKMIKYRSAYAEILYERSDIKSALGYLRDILEDNKDSPKLLGDIAIYYYRSGQMKRFEDYMEKVKKLSKKDQSFYEFLIKAAKLDERNRDVIKYSKELIKVNPGDLETRMILGEYLFVEKQFPQAVKVFESITERLRGFPRAHYYLAKIFIASGDANKALALSEEEVRLNKTLEFGYFIRAESYKALKKFQEAINDYEKSISINGKYVEALMGLAWIKHRQNFYEEARELYLRARKHDESNPEIYKRLGYVYKSTGNSGLAMESFQTYLDIFPAAPDRTRIEQEIKALR